ncbi:hypothetical protein TOT_010000292 [Theileria orientalis strain Shintoku]|uniref:Uncharacterized protein n=1 Tax=Theileria orientalis strain Shintoku TaxID=869250 RepID=J4DNE6_THEOR|nr:hypothetical protein TOT_010000292 [Theileria orientalis strain Shintoku]BAM38824.1 hypothetical protein TOT_010000292 [Theileria orientalis strain Shintoku]|eukprot:XP_009689125.1 hypothetical protein TOT_010000292 [Theileria orientalis strain Shintoku]
MVQKTSNDSILRYSHCGICTLLHYKFPHPYFFDSATHLLLPLIFYALMCPCLKLGPTFAAKEGFDDEMPPHVIADFTKFRLSRDPPPEDKLDSLRRESQVHLQINSQSSEER